MPEKKKKSYVKPSYYIILFNDGKRISTFHSSRTQKTIYSYWKRFKNAKPPRFIKKYSGKKRHNLIKVELALIFPNYKDAKTKFVQDEYGRQVKAEVSNQQFRIKEIIPYWIEDQIYDADNKTMIWYDQLINILTERLEISQIFTLNNKIIYQVDDHVRLFSVKNIDDAQRLFGLIREDLISMGYGNYIFVKDIDTEERVFLYDMLEKKGYSRASLIKHYSS